MLRRPLLATAAPALGAAPAPRAQQPLTVFPPARQTDVPLDHGTQSRARDNPAPRMSFAAVSALARQIGHGTPADRFMSADKPWMDDVQERNLTVTATRVPPTGKALVLIVPDRFPARVSLACGPDLAALLGPRDRIAPGDPANVPVSRYVQSDAIDARVARAESVRAAVQPIARGVAPSGIVHETDALATRDMRVVATLPVGSRPPITHPFAMTRHGGRDAAPRAFSASVATPEAAPTWQRLGFTLVR